jgi:uncharacterized protein DUF3309
MKGETAYAFSSTSTGSDRSRCSAVARKQLHTDGWVDQVDFERGCGHRRGCVATQRFRSIAFHFGTARRELVTESKEAREEEKKMLGTILIVILVMAVLGVLPRWSHSREWGYAPTGGVGLILVIVVILVLLGRI